MSARHPTKKPDDSPSNGDCRPATGSAPSFSAAYQAGYDTAKRGSFFRPNPYPTNKEAATAWDRGYAAFQFEQRRNVSHSTPKPMSEYLCHACGKTMMRESAKRWMKSICEATGKDVRIWRQNDQADTQPPSQ